MARIRSVHPGLFTDESFMELSSHAKISLIGIWGECFDDGVFALKAKTLKARILPAENVDMEEILLELEENGFFKIFKNDSKSYGAVRNFRRFQRPKKPNSSGLLPPNFRTYVGLRATGSEPVGNQFGTGGEKSIQREEGGGNIPSQEKDITDVSIGNTRGNVTTGTFGGSS